MPKVDYKRKQRSHIRCRTMRAAREFSGLSPVEWASRLGYTRQQIHNFEVHTAAELETLRAAGRIIGAPLEWMEFGWGDVPEGITQPEPAAPQQSDALAVEVLGEPDPSTVQQPPAADQAGRRSP